MMAKARKRRPGGGRKPQGTIRGKSKTFATRLTPETREALEREASASGQSISQIAERLLLLGLEERRKRGTNRPLRALCYVIEQIAREVFWTKFVPPAVLSDPALAAVARRKLNEWRTDPFHHRAFKTAVGMLLDALEPKGEIRSPFPAESIDRWSAPAAGFAHPAVVEQLKSAYKSPESLAAYTFSNVWARLDRADDLSDFELEVLRRGEWIGGAIKEEFYGMAEARVDLDLGSKGEGQ